MTTHPIRVLHLITSLGHGGAEMMLRKLVIYLDRSRFRNSIISLTPGGVLADQLQQAGIEVHHLNLRRSVPGPSAVVQAARLCASFRPHVLQGWMYHADALGIALRAVCSPARRAGWLWNVRCSDMDLSRYNPLTRLVIRGLATMSPYPHAVLVNSWAGMRHHTALGYRPRRWIVQPNGFDTDAFHPDPDAPAWLRQMIGCQQDARIVTMVARVDPMKDHETFLAAMALAKQRCPDLHGVLVGKGTGPEGPLAPLITKHGLTNSIHGLGERSDIARIFAGSTCAALSSAFGEGFPNVIGEAMSCATPCVTTDVGDAAMIVDSTGAVVPPRNPDAFAAALTTLTAESPDSRARRGADCRSRIISDFSLSAVARQYADIYESVASRDN